MIPNFPKIVNDPSRRGAVAAPMQYFGDGNRYGVEPHHSRDFSSVSGKPQEVSWHVYDFQRRLSKRRQSNLGNYCIRVAETLEEAIYGLPGGV